MRAKLYIVALIILMTGGIAWLDYSHGNSFSSASEPLESASAPAPNFTFSAVDGAAAYQLSDFKGKTILINFWASWCVPCLYEFPMLVDLAREHPDDLVLILLSSDKAAKQAYEFSNDFSIKQGLKSAKDKVLFPTLKNVFVAWDEDKQITRELFGTTRYPESIIIAPDLTMSEKIVGVLTEEQIKQIKEGL